MPSEIRDLYTRFYFPYLTFADYAYTLSRCIPNQPLEYRMKIENLRMDQLIAAYRNLRERRDAAKAAFTKEQKPTLDLMQQIEGEVHRRFNVDGANNFSCNAGTACRVTDTSVKVENWPAFFAWVIETQSYDMLEQRAAKTAVTAFVEEKHEVPPGLSIKKDESISIRAPRRG